LSTRLLPPAELHFFDGGPLTAQYLLAVDALNFCFWWGSDIMKFFWWCAPG
jgi:hypothetical protein